MSEPSKNLEAYQALLEIDEKERSFSSRQGYMKAYVISALLPPLGMYYFIKYVFIGNYSEDDKKVGWTCFILTTISIIVSIVTSLILFSQAASSLPATSSETLKQMVSPENQDALKKLFQ